MNSKARILWAASLVLTGQALFAQQGRGGAGPARGGITNGVPAGHAVASPAVPVRQANRPPSPNLGGRAFPLRQDVPTPTGLVAPAASYTGITPGALGPSNGSRGGGRNGARGGYGGGYGGFIAAPFFPYLDSGSGYSGSFPSFSEQAEAITAQSRAQEQAAYTQGQQDAVSEQLQRLSFDMQQMRESQNGRGEPALPAYGAPSQAQLVDQPPQTPITVVLQNGSKLSVSSYAVMNGVLWDFSKQPAKKIPLTAINVAASQAATEQAGAEFPQLNSAQ